MEKSSIRGLFFVLFTIFITIVLCSSPASSQREVEDESEFSYERNKENGPAKWGKLKLEWKMCGKGKMQSPIDLMNERVKFDEGLGNIKINGTQYQLLQLHWHSPSEHTINGRRFALELHMVHESNNGSMAVLTVLYKIGRPDSFLTLLEDKLEEIPEENEAEKNVGMIDPKKIKIGSRKYYRYVGSLTTPPCTQNVTWTVVKKIRTVTRKQVKLLRVAVHDDLNSNARPVQPTNKRVVNFYRPRSS